MRFFSVRSTVLLCLASFFLSTARAGNEERVARTVGAVLDLKCRTRPEWGDMAVSILKGEAMDTRKGWWRPAQKRHGWEWLRDRFDSNRDGRLQRSELPEAERYFERLDSDADGVVSAADFRGRPDEQGAGLARSFFRTLDNDSNGRVSRDELSKFFDRADREQLGFLTPEDLRRALSEPDSSRAKEGGKSEYPSPWQMLSMLLSGQLGSLTEGPAVDQRAPDFTLKTRDGTSSFTLSSSRGKKPVVLIFGSFT